MQNKILDIIYPEKCIVCHRILTGQKPQLQTGKRLQTKPQENMCPACQRNVLPVSEPRCRRCSKPVADLETELCGDCCGRTFYVERGFALYPYNAQMQRAIRNFKYDGEFVGGARFAEQMAAHYGAWVRGISPDVIIPVPIHKKRMRFRGFNQAACLAERIGDILGIPVDTDTLVRTENTKPQKGLGSRERYSNLQKSFAVRTDRCHTYRTVLLVDDIYTTGATLEACGKALKETGTRKICFLCLCIGSGEG